MYHFWGVIKIEHNLRMFVQQKVVAVHNSGATRCSSLRSTCWDQNTSESDSLQRARTA
jgi:hypothetical protein